MKATLRRLHIDTLVWNAYVIVLIGGTEKELRRTFEHYAVPLDMRDEWLKYIAEMPARSACVLDGGVISTYFVWVHATINDRSELAGSLAHEFMHAVVRIFRRRRLYLSEDSEEAFAYLHEYLTRETWKWFQRTGLPRFK